MKEPLPAKVTPPSKESVLKVGIILKEDNKHSFNVSASLEGFSFAGEAAPVPLQTKVRYTVKALNGQLEVTGPDRQLLSCKSPLLIDQPSPLPLAPRVGLEVDSVTAGRTFHWKKEVTQVFPGTLIVYAVDDRVVLVNSVRFEEYITCVIASEMSSACPSDFMKAQAVAARSWAMTFLTHKHTGEPYTICNDDDCQRYQGTTWINREVIDAVRGCSGNFLTAPDGTVCAAYYAKNCGGYSEDPEKVFGFKVPGITAVPDCDAPSAEGEMPDDSQCFCSPAMIKESELKKYLGAVDERGSYFKWKTSLGAEELAKLVREKMGASDAVSIMDLVPGPRGISGRILNMRISYLDFNSEIKELFLPDTYEIRKCLSQSFLYSSAFELSIERKPDNAVKTVHIEGRGWGHGIGLCQTGAVAMALKGYSYAQILKHYYRDSSLTQAY